MHEIYGRINSSVPPLTAKSPALHDIYNLPKEVKGRHLGMQHLAAFSFQKPVPLCCRLERDNTPAMLFPNLGIGVAAANRAQIGGQRTFQACSF